MTPVSRSQFAFVPKHQPHEVVYILRSLIEKALEWNIHIFIIDGDIQKAYDFTKHSVAIRGLLAAECPQIYVAASAREWRGIGTRIKCGGHLSHRIHKNRSLVQGDPAAPYIFNHALDGPLARLYILAQEHNWGFKLEDHNGTSHRMCSYCSQIITGSFLQVQAKHRTSRQAGSIF